MGTNVGFQQFWLTGARCYVQRDPIVLVPGAAAVEQPIVDLGRIAPVSPSIQPTVVQLMDADGGINRLIAEEMTAYQETYQVVFSNLNPFNMSLLFSANPPTSFSSVSAIEAAIPHYADPGALVKVRNPDGSFVYGLASVTVVAAGATTYVEGTDWEVVSLERGIIRMVSVAEGGAFAAAGNVDITYTPRAYSGNIQVNPATLGSVQATMLLVWGRKANRWQTVREARVSMTPGAARFGNDAFSEGEVRLSVLNDLTQPTPAGRILYWLGDLPAKSS
jgi:hypothetical protein